MILIINKMRYSHLLFFLFVIISIGCTSKQSSIQGKYQIIVDGVEEELIEIKKVKNNKYSIIADNQWEEDAIWDPKNKTLIGEWRYYHKNISGKHIATLNLDNSFSVIVQSKGSSKKSTRPVIWKPLTDDENAMGKNIAKNIYNKYSKSVGTIYIKEYDEEYSSNGTCWKYLDKVITNWHVIEDPYGKVYYSFDNGKTKHEIKNLSHYDVFNDIAVFNDVSKSKDSNIVLEDKMPSVGDRLVVIGNPFGLSKSLSEGLVSNIKNENRKTSIQFTAPVSPGSSGSPVFDSKGNVLGMATASYDEGQNLNFAIPSSYISDLLLKQDGEIPFEYHFK